VIISFTLIALVFIPVGLGLYFVSENVVEVVYQYDGDKSDTRACHVDKATKKDPASPSKHCIVTIKIKEDMEKPYIYYQLTNFYQNHRRYVKSRSDAQLQGEVLPYSELSDCDPLIRGDMRNASSGGAREILHPCGLVANSYFNDTFSIVKPANLSIDSSNIAWKSDRENKFKAVPQATKNKYVGQYQWLNETYPGVEDVTNQHFIVWMRTAALPTFRKLYGQIDTTLKANSEVDIAISAHFPVESFGGTKSIVLSTASFLGGKNSFLGIAYMVVGAICAFLAIAFWIKELYCPRKPGDVRWLRWRQD
jgi:LEM3 (ligand-effect modulator 3) family / CDC50 family